MQMPSTPELDQQTRECADELFHEHQLQTYRRTDRMFAALMVIQWLASIAAALWISPRTWSGSSSQLHIHVWAAIFLGGTITACGGAGAVVFGPRLDTSRHRRARRCSPARCSFT